LRHDPRDRFDHRRDCFAVVVALVLLRGAMARLVNCPPTDLILARHWRVF
jgi:hypothetical protein